MGDRVTIKGHYEHTVLREHYDFISQKWLYYLSDVKNVYSDGLKNEWFRESELELVEEEKDG